jgi:hypothetical protein
MAVVVRKQYKGAAAQTTITNSLGAGDTSITIAATTGWPSAAGVPFFVVISPGTAVEEKCLATISGSTLTLTRGQDDTTAQSHSSGATIYHVYSADDADEANLLASTLTTRGDLLTMGSGPDFARIAIGAADTVLKSNGTDVSYGTIVAENIASDAVTTAKILNDAVTTAKILNANVTGAKLANADINDQTASYTLVVGDRNKRVIMNVASASTVTVNDSIFSEGDSIFIANKASDACTITAGAGVTINTSGSLALAQYGGGTLIALSASTFTFFPAGGVNYGIATGGTPGPITDDGFSWTLLSFITDGTLTVSTAGIFDCLLIGAGGGSGINDADGGAGESTGGGAGGSVHITSLYLPAGTYTVDVGASGAGGTDGNSILSNGSQSSIYNSTTTTSLALAEGGGGGAGNWNAAQTGPINIGGSSWRTGYAPSAAVASQSVLCFTGGEAFSSAGNGAGGGAGAAGNGGNGTSTDGGAGGAGRTTTFTGSSVTYGSGGSGGGNSAGTAGSAIGGGAGGRQNGTTGNGSAGNAGAVYVRFR